jgi:hypothetical protein
MPLFYTGMDGTAGATGFEPAIFGLTGRHVHHYTTPPDARQTIPQLAAIVKFPRGICSRHPAQAAFTGRHPLRGLPAQCGAAPRSVDSDQGRLDPACTGTASPRNR